MNIPSFNPSAMRTPASAGANGVAAPARFGQASVGPTPQPVVFSGKDAKKPTTENRFLFYHAGQAIFGGGQLNTLA
jgi:hypothetical protein